MSSSATASTSQDQELIEGIFERIASDLGMIIDRQIKFSGVKTDRAHARPAGKKCVHISFKLAFKYGDQLQHGCLLLPLPDAIALAAYLMMVPDEVVQAQREATELDRSMKDAMLEIGNFISGAADAVVRGLSPKVSVRSEGCQGVRENVRPALVYEEGALLLVGRAEACIHAFPAFEAILVLPALPARE